MLMNLAQLRYDIEKDVIIFRNTELKQGDCLEIYVPSPVSGEMEWISVQLEWSRSPRERWYFVSSNPDINDYLSTCNPVGAFARR